MHAVVVICIGGRIPVRLIVQTMIVVNRMRVISAWWHAYGKAVVRVV